MGFLLIILITIIVMIIVVPSKKCCTCEQKIRKINGKQTKYGFACKTCQQEILRPAIIYGNQPEKCTDKKNISNRNMFKPVDHGRIVKAVILSTTQTNKTGSAVGRAVVGDFVAGPVGAIVGASTSKKKTTTRFLLIYADNFRQTVDVADGSWEYKEYMYYL